MEGTINVFHYSDTLYHSRYLGDKSDTFSTCVNEKYCSVLRNYPCWWDILATSMNPSSAPLVPSPMIVSTFSTSFLPSKTDASRENCFNVCDVVSVKMTEWQFKLTPWIWLHKVLPFLGLERPGPKCPVISKQQLLLALNDTQSSRIDVLL